MKHFLLIFVTVIAVSSCCAPKYIERVEYRDSIVIQIKERIVRDTVPFEVPVEVEKVVLPDTDTSRLENTFAISEAYVDTCGFLHHSLETKPQSIDVPVEIPVADTTSTQVHTEYITVEKPVPAELTWWQQFRLKGFWYLLGGLALALLWIFRKFIFRI